MRLYSNRVQTQVEIPCPQDIPNRGEKCRLWLLLGMFLFYLPLAAGGREIAQDRIRLELNTLWQFQSAGEQVWHPASVPGCVHTDLLNNRLIEDPFFRDNEKKLEWIGKTYWKYQTSFQAPPELLRCENVELLFEGLDTYAVVFLNGMRLIETNNMFRSWRISCRSVLKPGNNLLEVHFRSPIGVDLPRVRRDPHPLPAPQDPGEKTSPYTRKSPFQFGWDFSPRMITCGIWKPVFLEGWEGVRIADFQIHQKSVSAGEAKLTAVVEILVQRMCELRFSLELLAGEKPLAEQTIQFSPGKQTKSIDFSIFRPALWWPNGMGDQPLYPIRLRVWSGQRLIDETRLRVGIRTLELRQKEDFWGRSFQFVVNGVPIFAKGGNWVPGDSFPSRVSREKYQRLLLACRQANMNMIRVWGGGIYESQTFYDLCDELGLLVWQDFMFACALYPGDSDFVENVRQEAKENIVRLRNHPSLALWCGNNEVETGWFDWGWRKKYPVCFWDDYVRFFRNLLPRDCLHLDPGRPYWSSSPSSDLSGAPNAEGAGDVHYWGVWHQDLPFNAFGKQNPRFMSEFGFQSLPDLHSIEEFTLPADQKLLSPVLLSHQKNTWGNQRIWQTILREYPSPSTLESTIYASQLLQAEAVQRGVEYWRRNRFRCAGALFWQINDCWPGITWSAIDYQGRAKALYYFARRFYQNILVTACLEKEEVRCYIVSDEREKRPAQLRVRLLNFQGQTLREFQSGVEVIPLNSQVYWRIPVTQLLVGLDRGGLFLHCELQSGGRVVSSNSLFFLPFKRILLPAPEIRVVIEPNKNNWLIRLRSKNFAKSVFLSPEHTNGSFSDNYFDLLPGEEKLVEFTPNVPTVFTKAKREVKIRSFKDYLP
jgi:beta-mannosidase